MADRFLVRPEIHSLVWDFNIACSSGQTETLNRILRQVDAWRENGTATELEAAVWLGAIKVSVTKSCAGEIHPALDDALRLWTIYLKALRQVT